ncbi:L-fucose:H+ symporter permease [Lutibacter sp. B1]|uniref:L-fucose:H+ symporter permease n=1 Tax=Lutibacter sp. B1 TaxID=2725996 RepID=UPI0014578D23|nr:L-fucose:H+ symporter permease [Lutibacter sp. B1]NLP56906.1 L-fucose:H+ symporter permease [Lutibacter sp. B1]
MNKKIPVVSKEVILPFILITSLFALWGFANAVTDPMVSAFKKVLELDNLKASLVQLAFYGGYFTMALPAAYFMKKYSYKIGILIGLSLYAFGALLFYPAAALENYTFFLVALYILTFGLAFLETSANPYILAMGDKRTATRRLNLAQAFNPLGLITGLYVAQIFVLRKLQSDDFKNYNQLSETVKQNIRTSDLLVIRNPYVILGIVVLLLLFIISLIKMPEKKEENNSISIKQTFIRIFKKKNFTEGVIAQLFYVGAQTMCWTYIYQYAENIGINNKTAVNYSYIAFGLFLGGRFIFTYFLKFINPSKLLLYLAVLSIFLALGTIFIQGIGGLYCLITISFCMSLMFPTIYGIALADLGEDAKFASAFLVMAIVGGAILPVLQGFILDIGGIGYNDTSILGVPEVNFSFILPLICFFVITTYGYRSFKRS